MGGMSETLNLADVKRYFVWLCFCVLWHGRLV